MQIRTSLTLMWCGITYLCLSPNARLQAQELSLRATCKGHASPVYGLAVSPDGKTLASASVDKTVKLWEIASGKELATLRGHANSVFAVAFSPDGKMIASGDHDTIKLWDATTQMQIATLKGHSEVVMCLAFSPDGTTLASGSWDLKIRLWDTRSNKTIAIFTGHGPASSGVWSVCFSPDGKTLASGGGDSSIRIWDIQAAKEVIMLREDSLLGVQSVAFDKSGKHLASSGCGTSLRIWDIKTRQAKVTIDGPQSPAIFVAFGPDGSQVAGAWTYANKIKLVDAVTAEGRSDIETLFPTCMVFSPDGRTLASGSIDSSIRLWNVTTRRQGQ